MFEFLSETPFDPTGIYRVWNTLKKSCDLDLKSPKVFNAELNQLLKQIDNDINKSTQFWNLLTTSSYFESGEFIEPNYAYCAPASESTPDPI